MAVADIQSHPVFTLDEQLAMFAPGGSVQKALNEIVDFSISTALLPRNRSTR